MKIQALTEILLNNTKPFIDGRVAAIEFLPVLYKSAVYILSSFGFIELIVLTFKMNFC